MNVLKKFITYRSDEKAKESINNPKQNQDKFDLTERKNSSISIVEKENINKNIPHVVNIPRSLSQEYNASDNLIYNEFIDLRLKTCDTKVTKLKKD
jgi:hypothetical protein